MARKSWRPEWKLGRTLRIKELAEYGIDEEMALAVSSSARIALECVKMVPELHIISLVKSDKVTFYNRYVPHANSYILSDGDKNPDLIQVEELLCMRDIDELEEDFRDASGGALCAFDQSMFRFLRMMVARKVSIDALVDPEHRRRVRVGEMKEASRKRDG